MHTVFYGFEAEPSKSMNEYQSDNQAGITKLILDLFIPPLHTRAGRGCGPHFLPPAPPALPPPSSFRNFEMFLSDKTQIIRGNIASKWWSRTRRVGYSLRRLHDGVEAKEPNMNDITIELFFLGKAIYRLNVSRGNPLYGCYFHQKNNDNKANAENRTFCGSFEKSRLQWLQNEPL